MNKTASRSTLFLLEMIFVIFFFALTATVYVRLFASASSTASASRDLTESVIAAQNLAELFYAADGDGDTLRTYLKGQQMSLADTDDDNTIIVTYTDAWEAAQSADDVSYTAHMVLHTDGALRCADLTIRDGDRDIYTLALKHYPVRGKGGQP